jgi:Cytochrome c554 and c-prime
MRWGGGALVLAAVAVAVFGVAAMAQQAPSPAGRRASGCVTCHSRLADTTGAGHGFVAWRRSGHAAAGVGCEACHGGNAAAPDQATAHQGIAPSTDPASAVYFTRLPDTCGRCHVSEAGYFRSSVHFARLKADGRGPNCLTCHGSMATSVLTAQRVLGTCSACHEEGGVAQAGEAREAARVLSLLRSESVLLDVVSAQRASGGGAAGASRARFLLSDAERQLSAAAEVWHGFHLDSTVERLDVASRSVIAAWVALGHPAPRESPPFRGSGRR